MMPLWMDLYEDEDNDDVDWVALTMETEADEPHSHFMFDPDLFFISNPDLED